MVSIGGQKLIYAAHFLVLNDQQVMLETVYEGVALQIGLIFREVAGAETSMRSDIVGTQTNYEFTNWNHPAGTVSTGQNMFAKFPSGDVFFHVVSRFVAGHNHVHFYLQAA
jgi:hypothetical protein